MTAILMLLFLLAGPLPAYTEPDVCSQPSDLSRSVAWGQANGCFVADMKEHRGK